MVFLHIYIYGSVGLLGWFYSKVFNGFINKRVFEVGVILFWVVATTDIIVNDSLKEFNSFLLLIQSILFIIVSLFTYSFMLNQTIRELKAYLFYSLLWINSGLFIYYSSSLLLFYFDSTIKEIAKGTKLGAKMWVFHSFFILVMYSCFFVGLWKQRQK
ncbi:MAG: hypothetical protein MUE96_00385 [Bacteroidia bacterium]|jgi:hypothetical protein|nr:hypothetical protein [Bacteroidia bacterium]